jgi:hypothetical protein
MTRYICAGCGLQHDDTAAPPAACAVCSDERQYVLPTGQRWTTHEEIASRHKVRIERDGGLLAFGITPNFAIPQRALLVPDGVSNILWDCTSLVTDEAVDAIKAAGGVHAIAISHPHFYSSMVEWSDALGGVSIYLHEADRQWVQRRSLNIEFWRGDQCKLSDSLTLLHLPGHFPGSASLHCAKGPNGRPMLLAGDSIHVAQDRRHVTFMYSVPNYIPMHPDAVVRIASRLSEYEFDDLYGFTWGLNIMGDASAAVKRSLERYLAAVGR